MKKILEVIGENYGLEGDYFYFTGAYGKDGIVYSNCEVIRLA